MVLCTHSIFCAGIKSEEQTTNAKQQTRNNNIMPNAPCAAGTQCILGGFAPGTHKCPQCRHHIHVLCGAEVEVAPGGNQMHNIMMCFNCQQGSAPTTAVSVPVQYGTGTTVPRGIDTVIKRKETHTQETPKENCRKRRRKT